MHPNTEVVGLDGDPQVLTIAQSKARKAGVHIAFDLGTAVQLPYADESFDRVLASLLIHHLVTEDKQRTFGEAYRVLRPGGELHVLDFGKPRNVWARLVSVIMRRLERTSEAFAGLLGEMMGRTGFTKVEESTHMTTVFGTLYFYKATKPG